MQDQPIRGMGRRRNRAEADELAAAYDTGELTREEFCRRHRVAVSTLSRYVARWRRGQGRVDASRQWVEVDLAAGHARLDSGLAVVLSQGQRIEIGRGFDAVTLQQLVRTLELA